MPWFMRFSRVKLKNLEIFLVIWQILHLTCVCSMHSALIYSTSIWQSKLADILYLVGSFHFFVNFLSVFDHIGILYFVESFQFFVNSLPVFDHICRLIWFKFPPPQSNQGRKQYLNSTRTWDICILASKEKSDFLAKKLKRFLAPLIPPNVCVSTAMCVHMPGSPLHQIYWRFFCDIIHLIFPLYLLLCSPVIGNTKYEDA